MLVVVSDGKHAFCAAVKISGDVIVAGGSVYECRDIVRDLNEEADRWVTAGALYAPMTLSAQSQHGLAFHLAQKEIAYYCDQPAETLHTIRRLMAALL